MTEVIVFGAGKLGLYLKRDLENTKKYKVCFFCDNNPRKWDMSFDSVPVISFDKAVSMVTSKQFSGIVVVASRNGIEQIVDQIRESQIEIKVYGCSRKYLEGNKKEDLIYPIDYSKPRLCYFEYHVSHHCNLKCKGCGHYSNIADVEFGDIEKYIQDIKRLKELFWGVERIRLMGGEPLLNVNLPKFITETRNVFPDANIRVVTNGLLIPQISTTVFETMHNNAVGFDITQYMPTSQLKEKIEMRCWEMDVQYGMSPLVTQFFNNENIKGDSDRQENHEKCISKKCHFLLDGKISVCGLPILSNKFKDKLMHQKEIAEEDVVDIYDKELDGFSLNDFLSKSISMCRYCDNINLKRFDWEGNYPYLL